MIGLYAVQRPRIGRLGLFGAVAFASSYVTSNVIYALTAGTQNWNALGKVFGAWMTIHGLIMVVGGAALVWRWCGLPASSSVRPSPFIPARINRGVHFKSTDTA